MLFEIANAGKTGKPEEKKNGEEEERMRQPSHEKTPAWPPSMSDVMSHDSTPQEEGLTAIVLVLHK